MKLLKKVLTVILTSLIVLFTLSSIYTFVLIVHENYEYKQYLNEEKEIYVSMNPKGNTTINYLDYENMEEYQSYYQEELNDYKKIKELDYVEGFDYYSWYLFTNDGEAWLCGENSFDDVIEGRTFTNDEITSASNVGIISEQFATEKGLNVGDVYVLTHPMYKLTPIEIEVIGIYDPIDIPVSPDTLGIKAIYMPFNSVDKIANTWLNELLNEHSDEIKKFIPIPSLGTEKIYVKSEGDYLKLCDYIDNELSQGNIQYNYQLMFGYSTSADYDTSEYKEYLIFSLIVSFILVNLLVCTKKLFDIKFTKSQKKFEKELMKEKEKNVHDVFQMNQETHQLKHDMKHFLIQLATLIENKENDKSLEYIKEYYEDIEALEIPVYTQNSTLDLLISHYSKKAKEMNIDFTYSGNLVNELKVNDRKLFILLSNALDNAFNHCNDNKTINFSLTYVEPYHRFVIVNSFDKKNEINEDKEHGFGLISMKKLVEEMKGELIIEEKENKFICTILIP